MEDSVNVEEIENFIDTEEKRIHDEEEEKKGEIATNKEEKGEEEGGNGNGNGNGNGKLGNLISKFFHHDQGGPDGGGKPPEEEEAHEVSDAPPEKQADSSSNGGVGGGGSGLVDSLIASLPLPLSEEAAPATDEASILIHSIVHD